MRCVPPQNKPLPAEIKACRPFLDRELAAMSEVRAILALGRVAHEAALRTLGHRLADHPFGHGARHAVAGPAGRPLQLFDSYHCSRYNTNTGRLTAPMFSSVFEAIRDAL